MARRHGRAPFNRGKGLVPEVEVQVHGFVDHSVVYQIFDPEAGVGPKELFLTANPDPLYVISPVAPSGELMIKDYTLGSAMTIELVGVGGDAFGSSQVGADIIVAIPA